MGLKSPGLTIPVPETAGNAIQADAPRYTLELAVAPGSGNWVRIELSDPSGDGDLEYFDPKSRQQTYFSWAGNNFVSTELRISSSRRTTPTASTARPRSGTP